MLDLHGCHHQGDGCLLGSRRNNVNASMGVLTTITLLLSIPTVVFSFYGMNTNLCPW